VIKIAKDRDKERERNNSNNNKRVRIKEQWQMRQNKTERIDLSGYINYHKQMRERGICRQKNKNKEYLKNKR